MEELFFGNTCVSGVIYHQLKMVYNNPFIWHLFLDGSDYIKVCKNFDHYLNQEPLLIPQDEKDGRYTAHPKITDNYPIIRLDDVNIHFIHHSNGNDVIEKYKRRRDRLGEYTLIPVAWGKELKTPEIIKEFNKLENSILVNGVTTQLEAANAIIKIHNG